VGSEVGSGVAVWVDSPDNREFITTARNVGTKGKTTWYLAAENKRDSEKQGL
jgi:hypothetical protein